MFCGELDTRPQYSPVNAKRWIGSQNATEIKMRDLYKSTIIKAI